MIELDYGDYEHRYRPHMRANGNDWLAVDADAVSVSPDEDIATLTIELAAGRTIVAGQPVLSAAETLAPMDALVSAGSLRRVQFGTSLAGNPLYAYEAGDENSQFVVVALSRQHPPEVTGAEAFTHFANALLKDASAQFLESTAVILVPVVNPDGVDGGNWRLNLGGIDLNRDWLEQSQPETRAITEYLETRASGRRTIAFLDFHSTWRTLVYSPPFDNASPDALLLPTLQTDLERAACGPSEWIFGHNADRGTSKAWALQTLGAPGLTIEFGDNEDRAAIACSAQQIAATVLTYAGAVMRAEAN